MYIYIYTYVCIYNVCSLSLYIYIYTHIHSCLVDASMRASAKQNLSELLRVSQRLSLALAARYFSLKEQL